MSGYVIAHLDLGQRVILKPLRLLDVAIERYGFPETYMHKLNVFVR